jgi:hypothetical protein
MPYMPFNWFAHSARVCRLTLPERGLFDAVRSELWSVVGCKMPREALLSRLRIDSGSPEAAMVDQLVRLGLLVQDPEGFVYDVVQTAEFEEAVRKGEVARENGSKGGRPRKLAPQAEGAASRDF